MYIIHAVLKGFCWEIVCGRQIKPYMIYSVNHTSAPQPPYTGYVIAGECWVKIGGHLPKMADLQADRRAQLASLWIDYFRQIDLVWTGKGKEPSTDPTDL